MLCVGAGTATAAVLITSQDVKNDTLRSIDVRDDTLRSHDIRNDSLVGADIRDRSLRLKELTARAHERLKGEPGAQGEQGEPGEKGEKGEQGLKGDTGETGTTGSAGPQGDQGPKGDTGAQGEEGEQGPAGPDGLIGPKGDTGATGPTGPAGPQGPIGAQGLAGADATYAGPNWSIVDRNVIGNGDSYLRAGPDKAPSGDGSLGLRTGSDTDRAAFGNQVDFFGYPVAKLNAVGFSVFTTAANNERGDNMPRISFEIDPNLESSESNESSLVFIPNNSQPDTWTDIDATTAEAGRWGLTGEAGRVSSCSIEESRCSFEEVQKAVNDGGEEAIITLSAQITMDSGLAFSGAVDNLVINETTYDFEPLGVYAR